MNIHLFECADGRKISLGAIEPQFYAELMGRLGLDDVDGAQQPAPSPRFSRAPARMPSPDPQPGEHTQQILRELGINAGTQPPQGED